SAGEIRNGYDHGLLRSFTSSQFCFCPMFAQARCCRTKQLQVKTKKEDLKRRNERITIRIRTSPTLAPSSPALLWANESGNVVWLSLPRISFCPFPQAVQDPRLHRRRHPVHHPPLRERAAVDLDVAGLGGGEDHLAALRGVDPLDDPLRAAGVELGE